MGLEDRDRRRLTEEERIAQWQGGTWEEEMVYEDGLPPPLPTVEVTTIVPAYRELENGNFWRLLQNACEQELGAEKFEVILVVNNKLRSAERGADDFKENQNLLLVCRTLQEAIASFKKSVSLEEICSSAFRTIENSGIELSDWEKEIFKKAVRKGVRFFAIDASSEDRVPFDESEGLNMIGVARQIGARIAYRRYHQHGHQDTGLIDFIDADCGFPPNYYRKIIEAAATYESENGFVKEIKTYAPEIPEWRSLPPLDRVGHLFHYLRQNITTRQRKYDDTDMHHAPSPIVRASFFKEIGGYYFDTSNEDYQFARLVKSKTKTAPVRGTHVRLSDRMSENGVDGYRWYGPSIGSGMTESPEKFATYFDPTNLDTLEGGEQGYRTLIEGVLKYDTAYEEDSTYRDFRKKRWEEEVAQSKRRVPAFKATIHVLVDVIQKVRPTPETFSDRKNFKAWLNRNLKGRLDAKTIDTLLRNPIMMIAMVTVMKLMQEEGDRAKLGVAPDLALEAASWNFFEKYLPEYCVELSDAEPDYDLMRKEMQNDRLPTGYSLRYITHLVRAQRDHRVERKFKKDRR